jgi:hypothetical protein
MKILRLKYLKVREIERQVFVAAAAVFGHCVRISILEDVRCQDRENHGSILLASHP